MKKINLVGSNLIEIFSATLVVLMYLFFFVFIYLDISFYDLKVLADSNKYSELGTILAGIFSPLVFIFLLFQYTLQFKAFLSSMSIEAKRDILEDKSNQAYYVINNFEYKYEENTDFDPVKEEYKNSKPCNKINFDILNLGANSKAVEISIEDNEIKLEQYIANEINHSEKKTISIDMKIPIKTKNLIIRFFYLDSKNIQKRKYFYITLYPSTSKKALEAQSLIHFKTKKELNRLQFPSKKWFFPWQ